MSVSMHSMEFVLSIYAPFLSLEWGVTIRKLPPRGNQSPQVDSMRAGHLECFLSSSLSSCNDCDIVAGIFTVSGVAYSGRGGEEQAAPSAHRLPYCTLQRVPH